GARGRGTDHVLRRERGCPSQEGPMNPREAPPGQPIGDFTTTRRVIPLSLLAIGVGMLATGAAYGLLALIGFFTNLFFFHRLGIADRDLLRRRADRRLRHALAGAGGHHLRAPVHGAGPEALDPDGEG